MEIVERAVNATLGWFINTDDEGFAPQSLLVRAGYKYLRFICKHSENHWAVVAAVDQVVFLSRRVGDRTVSYPVIIITFRETRVKCRLGGTHTHKQYFII